MRIDKINSYNFNISNKKPVLKKEEAGFNQPNYATLPVDSKFWQVLSFRGAADKACLKEKYNMLTDEQFDELYSIAKKVFTEETDLNQGFRYIVYGCYDEKKQELKPKVTNLAKLAADEKPEWIANSPNCLACFEEDFLPSPSESIEKGLLDFNLGNFFSFYTVVKICTNGEEFDDELYQKIIEGLNPQSFEDSYGTICKCSSDIPHSMRHSVIKESIEVFDDVESAFNHVFDIYKICYEDKEKPDKERAQLVKDLHDNFPDWSDVRRGGRGSLFYQAVETLKETPCEFLRQIMFQFKDAGMDVSFSCFLKCCELCRQLENIENLTIQDKIRCLAELETMDEDIIEKLNLSSSINKLRKSVFSVPLNSADEKDTKITFQTLFDSKNNGLSSFETTLKDSIETLKTYKDGLALKYSRSKFLSDLDKLNLDNQTFSKLSIEPIYEDDKLTGYNGFIMLDEIDKESELYKICHKFLYENEIQTDNKELNLELNKIIKAIPEFINIIGKNQHATHKYSLDIHLLLVLANSIDNPGYKNLNASDKAILKTVCLLHDLTKEQGVVDKGHPNSSSVYTKAILTRFFKNPEALDRAYELTKNHHWLQELSEAETEEDYRKIAFCFRRKNDFELAKIMADSDLKSVSDDFYFKHKDAFNKTSEIEKLLQTYYESGSALFVDTPAKNCLKVKIKDGYSYKVLNFNEIDNNQDLSYLGFDKGKTKNDVRFLVHMVNENNLKKNLQTLSHLTSSASQAALSESVVSPNIFNTYYGREYGVILNELNTNIANIANKNQHSGYLKSYEDTIDIGFEKGSYRNNFKANLLDLLRVDCTDEQYADFYKNHLAAKTRLSQIKDDEIFELGNRTFSGLELKKAINDFQNSLLDSTQHNEIVGFTPKIKGVIARAESLDAVPNELLEFARNNDLPVVLV